MLVWDKIENKLQKLALLDPKLRDLEALNDLSDVLNNITAIRQGRIDAGLTQDLEAEYVFLGQIIDEVRERANEASLRASDMISEIAKIRQLMLSDEAQQELMAEELYDLIDGGDETAEYPQMGSAYSSHGIQM